jgi:hypothetical protein
MNERQNLCVNGDFEMLHQSAARPLPQGWHEVREGGTGAAGVSDDALHGRRSLRLRARGGDPVGMNSSVITAGRGRATIRYKVIASDADGANLAAHVLAVDGAGGGQVDRRSYRPPTEHVGDGEWHEAVIDFDFASEGVRQCRVALTVNEGAAGTGAGEWLIDGVEVHAAEAGAVIRLARLWSDRPLARTGDVIRFSAFVENRGDAAAADVRIELAAPRGIEPREAAVRSHPIEPGSFHRFDWALVARSAAMVEIEVAASQGAMTERLSYRVMIVDRSSSPTRQELCTDDAGYWRLLDRPATLQEGNAAALRSIRHLKSSEIGRNPFGICIHVPRSRDFEAPFDPAHLIDGDAETVWSSQQNVSPYPGVPPWVEIDLGRTCSIAQINLIPYWRNTDFPVGFSIHAIPDSGDRRTVERRTAYQLQQTAERRGDKLVQPFPLVRAVEARRVRVEFERLPLSGGNYAEVSQGYKARLSGIEVIDDQGQNVALLERGATVTASEYFTGWNDTAEAVRESFSRIFDLGVKWVRLGQWGDQTEWAAVERRKGFYEVDPETDRALHELVDNGVDILYGLNYGNELYEPREEPAIDVGPIFTEGHPFYKHCGPRTEEGRQAFVRYVDFVVRRYGDRIRWWELWNEENCWYPGSEPELYGKLLYAVASHIKAIDPDAKVMFGGTAEPAPITTGISLREGAAPYLDAGAFHPYGIAKPEAGMGTMESHQGENLGRTPEETGWSRLEEVIEGVREPFARYGRPDVEIWLNEWGTNVSGLEFTYDPRIGEYGCAKYLMRFYVYGGWLGSPPAWWALHSLNRSQDWGILDQADCGLRPMSYALQNVCSVLSDVTPDRSLQCDYEGGAPDPTIVGYRKDGTGDTLVAVWAAELHTEDVRSYPSRLSFELEKRPEQVTVTDLYWGVSQPARWSYEAGVLTLEGVIVRDYPVVVSCH